MPLVFAPPSTRVAGGVFCVVVICVFGRGLLAPENALAQQGQTATLSGTVTDSSGAALAEVTLTVSSPSLIGGARQATTDAGGQYRFASLSPGIYAVTIARQGFKTVRHSAFELPPG